MTPKEVLDLAKENGAKLVDLRFVDFPGLWHHISVPVGELEESSFEDGFGFDGSSIRGWQPIHASDMLVIPDAGTAKMDPFAVFEIVIGVLPTVASLQSSFFVLHVADGYRIVECGSFRHWGRPVSPKTLIGHAAEAKPAHRCASRGEG